LSPAPGHAAPFRVLKNMAAESPSRRYVSSADSLELLSSLQSLAGDPRCGFFGPGSVTWRVNRESAVFLAAGRAALLQLAHPWVAVALAHHSTLLNDAVGRFHSTFRVIYTMLFGTRAQAIEAAKQLYQRHTNIRGELPHAIGIHAQGEHYEANEVAALCWVYATLVDSAILAYEFILPPLSFDEREQYYQESKRMAALFGIPAAALPNDWAGFARYTAEMFESPQLGVDANALALARSVLSGVGTWLRPPHWYHAVTAFWMPPRLRAGFALPFSAKEQQTVERAARWLPQVYLHSPAMLRFVGPFHEAEARLRGRSPGAFTRRSNRFWMGEPRLLYSDSTE
jgi:uncharacterized protein (DUF2236 family)